MSGKGILAVAHGGGPTAVINCSLYGVVKEAMKIGKADGVIGFSHGIEGVFRREYIDIGKQPKKVLEGLKQTPGSAIGSCRRKVHHEDYPELLSILRELNVKYFLYNGGNDSMDTANKLYNLARDRNYPLQVVGIPKTVDNDLLHTDHCPGFPSAARYVAQSVRDVGMDIEALPTPVTIFETMGRNAGWLAISSFMAREREDDAPHLVYIPERPFDTEMFLQDIQDTYKRLGRVVAVVSEGVRNFAGESIYTTSREVQTDGFGHKLPGDVSSFLANQVMAGLGLRARSEKPGLCGRTSIELASPVDQEEAEALGRAAINQVFAGHSGVMVGLRRISQKPYRCEVVDIPFEEVANKERLVDTEFLGPDARSENPALRDYLLPLFGRNLLSYVRLQK